MKIRKIMTACLSLVLCLSMLTGCDLLPPKTAADLIQRSNEVMVGVDNYKMDMNMSVDVSVAGEMEGVEVSIDLPIELDMAFEVADTNIHGEGDMEMTMEAVVEYGEERETMTEAFDSEVDMYYVISDDGKSVMSYTNTDDEGWISEEIDADDMQIDMQKLLDINSDSALFENAEMEKADGVYTVSVALSDMLSNDDFVDLMEDSIDADSMDIGNIDWDDFADAVGDAVVVYTFDAKTYQLLGMSTGSVEIDTLDFVDDMSGLGMDGISLDEVSVTMELTISLSDFGKVDSDDVTVSDDIIADAEEAENFDIIDTDIPDDDDDDVIVTIEPDDTSVTVVTDAVFAYNGIELHMPTDYTVFVNDGWYAVDDGEYESFLCMENDKYPDLTLYLHTNDGSGSEESVKNNGADGFSLSVYAGDKYPTVSYAGITFGDTAEDIFAALGEPESKSESSDSWGTYAMYSYTIEYDNKTCHLSISLTDGVVTDIDVSYWD